jgi:hypothetical protein
MSADIIRLDRLALLAILVTFGVVFKFVVLFRTLCLAAKNWPKWACGASVLGVRSRGRICRRLPEWR